MFKFKKAIIYLLSWMLIFNLLVLGKLNAADLNLSDITCMGKNTSVGALEDKQSVICGKFADFFYKCKKCLLNINPKKSKAKDQFVKVIKEACKYSSEARRDLLENIPFDFIIENAPENVKDPKNQKLRSYQKNTGIYLWTKGYDIDEFVGAGANAVIWSCKNSNKVIRVSCDRYYLFGLVHIKYGFYEYCDSKWINEKLNFENCTKKHLSLFKPILYDKDRGYAIFEGEKAKYGNLEKFVKSLNYENKVLFSVQVLSDVLNGLKILHDKGFSHNDIKPDNLLVVEKKSKKAPSISKKSIAVTDLGNVTKISNAYRFTNTNYHAPDYYKKEDGSVKKRDVYSLGAITLCMLCDNDIAGKKYHIYVDYLVKNNVDEFFNKFLKSTYSNVEKNEKEIIFELLNILKNMIQPSYRNRYSLDESLTNLRKLKNKIANIV